MSIPTSLDQLERVINSTVLEREAETRCLLNALLSRQHICMIGSPGTAKTFLTRYMISLIADIAPGEYFEWLLGKFDTPEALVGPHSLKALQEDRYIRNCRRKLPVAKLAFISEIWKASSPLLNILLPILNERLFYNDDEPVTVPLATLVADSNEIPEPGSELAALWDRFAFRLFTKPLQNESNFDSVLRAAEERNRTDEPPVSLMSWADIQEAQIAVRQIEVSDEVFTALNSLRTELALQGVEPSVRRFVGSIPIIQAQAYRRQVQVAEIEDMRLLAHVLWEAEKQQPLVQRMVYEIANPLDKTALDMLDTVEVLAVQVSELSELDSANQRKALASEIALKLQEHASDVAKLRVQVDATGRQSEVIGPLTDRILGLNQQLLQVLDIGEDG